MEAEENHYTLERAMREEQKIANNRELSYLRIRTDLARIRLDISENELQNLKLARFVFFVLSFVFIAPFLVLELGEYHPYRNTPFYYAGVSVSIAGSMFLLKAFYVWFRINNGTNVDHLQQRWKELLDIHNETKKQEISKNGYL